MQINIGDNASISKTISEYDVYAFAGICGDFNPVHINRIEAENSRFGSQVVHGALVSAFISTVIGMKLPGPGTIYMSQTSSFIKPVYLGDTITAKVEVVDIVKNKAILQTQVYNQLNELVLDGEAKVLLPNA